MPACPAVTALFNDLVSWVSGRNAQQQAKGSGGSQQFADAGEHPHFDKEAQAAAAAEIRQDAADERGHAVRGCALDTAAPAHAARRSGTECPHCPEHLSARRAAMHCVLGRASKLAACRSSCGWPCQAQRLEPPPRPVCCVDREHPCPQEALKGLDHKSLSEDIVKHAQYHYNPGRDIVFRGEFIPVRVCLIPAGDPDPTPHLASLWFKLPRVR